MCSPLSTRASDLYYAQSIQLLRLLNSANSAAIRGYSAKNNTFVLCVHLLRCVYICSVPVQQCVHLLSTDACTLYLLSTTMCIYFPGTVAKKSTNQSQVCVYGVHTMRFPITRPTSRSITYFKIPKYNNKSVSALFRNMPRN